MLLSLVRKRCTHLFKGGLVQKLGNGEWLKGLRLGMEDVVRLLPKNIQNDQAHKRFGFLKVMYPINVRDRGLFDL